MASYRQIFYHLTFRTKSNKRSLNNSDNEKLYRYIWGIFKNRNCRLYQINGVADHIHIICDLHPSVALADLVKDIKVSTSIWIKKNRVYPKFTAWASGYGAFTFSIKEKDALVRYVKNQQKHHETCSFRDEYLKILTENKVEFDERYLP